MFHTWILWTLSCVILMGIVSNHSNLTHIHAALSCIQITVFIFGALQQVKTTDYFGTPLAEAPAASQCETILQHGHSKGLLFTAETSDSDSSITHTCNVHSLTPYVLSAYLSESS